VDFDHGINMAIGVLRRALGDSADNPQYIETLAAARLSLAGKLLSGWKQPQKPSGWGSHPAGIARTEGLVGRKSPTIACLR